MFALRLAGVALLAIGPVLAGCSTDSSKPSAPASSAVAAHDTDIFQYLKDHSVSLAPQTAADDIPLRVSIQQPPKWLAYNQAPSTYILLLDVQATDQKFTPNAVINVIKLTGNFDPRQAILRGYVDTQRAQSFHQIRASLDDFDGFPSSYIEGTFVETKEQLEAQQKAAQKSASTDDDQIDDLTLHVSTRYVIATSGDEKYLVQLTVTTTEGQAAPLAEDTKELNDGLKLSFEKNPAPATPTS